MRKLAIDFNPKRPSFVRQALVLAAAAFAFAIASDMYLERVQGRDADPVPASTSGKHKRHAVRADNKPPDSLDEAQAQRIKEALAYDWNPVLDQLEAFAGEGMTVRQFSHDPAARVSTIRFEAASVESLLAAQGRLGSQLQDQQTLRIDQLTQSVRDGQTFVEGSLRIVSSATKQGSQEVR